MTPLDLAGQKRFAGLIRILSKNFTPTTPPKISPENTAAEKMPEKNAISQEQIDNLTQKDEVDTTAVATNIQRGSTDQIR